MISFYSFNSFNSHSLPYSPLLHPPTLTPLHHPPPNHFSTSQTFQKILGPYGRPFSPTIDDSRATSPSTDFFDPRVMSPGRNSENNELNSSLFYNFSQFYFHSIFIFSFYLFFIYIFHFY